MPELTYFQRKFSIEILGQVLNGKRHDLLMDTILKMQVAAIVQLGDRLLKLEKRDA